LTLVVAVALVAIAAPGAAHANDPLYPFESYADWLGNVQQSAMDPAAGQYTFQEGFYGALRREAQRLPAALLTNSPRQNLQVAFDSLLHMRPDLPYSHATDAGDPRNMPDWNHNRIFGDGGGYGINDEGDFDADTDAVQDTAYFRYPCSVAADGWQGHHRYVDGTCDTTDAGAEPYALGVAREVSIVDSRGLLLDATLWFPGDAFAGNGCPALADPEYGDRGRWTGCVSAGNFAPAKHPGIVFSDGLASRQDEYYWFAMRMAADGYVVLTYDPAGQGQSEGTSYDLFGFTDPAKPSACRFGGACHDLQDAVRWFTGQTITSVHDTGFRFAPRHDPARNAPNPALPILDTSHVAIAGNSMGALSVLNYLYHQARGADGRPLPPVVAAVSMSGAAATRANVPTQFQTSDYDGSPLLVTGDLFGLNLGFRGQGIGYKVIKERYDSLRDARKGGGALALVVFEGGVHTDSVDVPYVPRTIWANAIAGDEAQAWLDCYVRGDPSACADTTSATPGGIDHLSKSFASEEDADGPAGPSPSRCIVVPTEANLNQTPIAFLKAETGHPVYDCVP
jgi:hypothetical protein